MPTQPPVVRTESQILHLKILGWIHIISGAIAFPLGLFAMYALNSDSNLIPLETKNLLLESGYVGGLLLLFLGLAMVTIVTGIGLIRQARWARTILWVTAIIGLVDFPFGTIFGIYAIWVLTRKNGMFSY